MKLRYHAQISSYFIFLANEFMRVPFRQDNNYLTNKNLILTPKLWKE